MRYIWPIVATLSLAPLLASAAPRTFQELAFDLVELIDTATITAIILGLVIYFWFMAINIPHFGDEEGAEKRKSFFFWGVIILFVMVSIWGIVQLIQNTLFGSSPYSPATGEPADVFCDDFFTCGSSE